MHWPLLNMYAEILDLGWGGFVISRTSNNRMKGLVVMVWVHVTIDSKNMECESRLCQSRSPICIYASCSVESRP